MDLKALLSEHRIRFTEGGRHHHVRTGWIGIDCPRCGRGTGKFHAAIHAHSLTSHCWRCGRLDTAELLADLTGVALRVAIGWLGGVERQRFKSTVKKIGKVVLPPGIGDLLPVHRRYLSSRGFDPVSVASIWGVRGIGLAVKLAWRLFLPIDCEGATVSWTTRAVGESSRRYISAGPGEEAVSMKTILYGEDLVWGNSVVVLEGPLDAIAVGPGAVATLGLGVTPDQLARIARYPMRTICFDAEPSAQRRARAVAASLAPYPGITRVIAIESGKDAAEADPAELAEIRHSFLSL